MPEPFPSWDDFRFFLATTKAGSFSKAASELGVTQPTISRRIESLEQRLGVRLGKPWLMGLCGSPVTPMTRSPSRCTRTWQTP